MEKEVLIIDRIEGEIIVCEDFFSGKQKDIFKNYIESNFKEGDVLVKNGNLYTVDNIKTVQRKAKINSKFNSIW